MQLLLSCLPETPGLLHWGLNLGKNGCFVTIPVTIATITTINHTDNPLQGLATTKMPQHFVANNH